MAIGGFDRGKSTAFPESRSLGPIVMYEEQIKLKVDSP